MIIYVEGEKVVCPRDPDDPSDDFAALCQWVDSKTGAFWASSPFITDADGRIIQVSVSSSVCYDTSKKTDLEELAWETTK